jgi:tetratricopeptide (TPR) repeat protein
MKKYLLTVLMALFAVVTYADNGLGKEYFGIGEYQKAKEIFEAQLSTSPAVANYYLGEIAWAEGKPDEALSFYEIGIKADPSYAFNLIGKGKVMLKNSPAQAPALFASALKKQYKKDPAANVAVVRAYFENGLKTEMTDQLIKVRKVAKKSADLYILEGDILMAEDKKTEAIGMYEQAIYFEPGNIVASMKVAEAYVSTQEPTSSATPLAVEKLDPILKAHPEFTVAYRTYGRAYNAFGRYKQAIESFVKYYGEGNCDIEDVTRLASSYYFTDQNEKAQQILEIGLKQDPENFVYNRLRMYVASKTKDTIVGLPLAEKFFKMNGKYIDKDYASYALILADAGRFDEALAQYGKVLKENPDKPETYMELAPLYSKMNEFVKSAEAYQKYIDLLGGIDVAEGTEYYKMGIAWNKAGQALRSDSTSAGRALAKEYLIKADTAFGVVCAKIPDSYIGYLYRGNANFEMDSETTKGIAEPYYAKALEIILKKIENGDAASGYASNLKTIYSYMAYHFFQRDDKNNTLLYSNKLLELDPKNKLASQLIEVMKQEAAQPAKK